MREFRIKRLLSGGIITNYNCPSLCAHCLYRCGPHRSSDYLDQQTAMQIFANMREMGCRSVHIGGGEPLLRPKELGKVLEAASNCGMGIDYVETNCAWYKDEKSARHILQDLKQCGLRTLLVSISPFHNESIPFYKTKGVLEAAKETGIKLMPWVEDFMPEISSLDPHKPHSLGEYQERFGDNYLPSILDRYWVHFGGRALDTFRPWFTTKEAESIMAEDRGGCAKELLNTSHFHIDLYDNYIPGLCSGLAIDRKHLAQDLGRDDYPLLRLLFEKGVAGLYDLARQKYGFEGSRQGYINKCDLCTDMRFHLVRNNAWEEYKELRPVEFYSII